MLAYGECVALVLYNIEFVFSNHLAEPPIVCLKVHTLVPDLCGSDEVVEVEQSHRKCPRSRNKLASTIGVHEED